MLDPATIPPVTLDHACTQLLPITGIIVSNPLHNIPEPGGPVRRDTPAGSTRTLAPQEIHHHTLSALKAATRGITTQADLNRFMGRMADTQCVMSLSVRSMLLIPTSRSAEQQEHLLSQRPAGIRDPPALNPKGRPRTRRLAAACEGVRA